MLFWILAFAPVLVGFVAGHWKTHTEIARRLEGPASVEWQALSLRDRLALRWTLRRGRGVDDPARANLAAQVAAVELTLADAPNGRRNAVVVGIAAAAVGVAPAIAGDGPIALMVFLIAALFLWSAACQPSLVRCLSRAAEANARVRP